MVCVSLVTFHNEFPNIGKIRASIATGQGTGNDDQRPAPETFSAAWAQFSLKGSRELLANVSALMAAWRPGCEGGPALLNLLSGATNPSGEQRKASKQETDLCPDSFPSQKDLVP